MKKITLLLCAGLFSLGMNAQFASEDFDAGLPADWMTVINTGSCDWFNGADLPTGPDFASPGMYFDDDACGNGADPSNTTLMSAVYDLSGTTGDITIAYDVAFQEVASGETFVTEWYDGAAWNVLATYDVDLPEILSESFSPTGITNPDFQLRWTYDDAAGAWGWHGGIDNFSLDAVLSTDDNQIAGFSMYPNPANDVVTVKAQNEIQNVTFFNILGQKVLEVAPNALSQEINVATLKAGVYVVNVTSDAQVGSYRLIKQ
ncbi:T9SS type A sorting domain-containing protein [Gilvibacter sp.]|uniref:T9SS type A sorting domain-containing protein n=1 Tax=Gilvibacter sp. TaxID=2729997 RepID=UPI003F4A145F